MRSLTHSMFERALIKSAGIVDSVKMILSNPSVYHDLVKKVEINALGSKKPATLLEEAQKIEYAPYLYGAALGGLGAAGIMGMKNMLEEEEEDEE